MAFAGTSTVRTPAATLAVTEVGVALKWTWRRSTVIVPNSVRYVRCTCDTLLGWMIRMPVPPLIGTPVEARKLKNAADNRMKHGHERQEDQRDETSQHVLTCGGAQRQYGQYGEEDQPEQPEAAAEFRHPAEGRDHDDRHDDDAG